jgi:hypothetical protein
MAEVAATLTNMKTYVFSTTSQVFPQRASLTSKFSLNDFKRAGNGRTNMDTLLYKIGLGLALALIICLFPMPYGYYTLVRFAAMIIFACMAFSFYKEEQIPLSIIAGALALLFQPFVKLPLGRTVWNAVDVIVAIALVILWYRNRN